MSPLIQHYSFPRAPLISSFSSVFPLPFFFFHFFPSPLLTVIGTLLILKTLLQSLIHTSHHNASNFATINSLCQFQCISIKVVASQCILDPAWSIFTYIQQFHVCPLCYHCKITHACSMLPTLFTTLFFSPHLFSFSSI